jgi:hypothetical protein
MVFGRGPILRRKAILSAGLFLEKRSILGKTSFWKGRPNFGVRSIDGKKSACRKRRKRSMQDEKQCGTQVGKPNHDKVRVFDKDCNGYKPIK